MSLENEYWNEKQILENAKENLKKFEELNIENMGDNQIDARERGIRIVKEEIAESEEILSEIKDELEEFINNGGEVSKELKEELSNEDDSSEDDSETIIEFRGYNGECSICGFMRLEEADDEAPLQFYDSQGLEIGYNYPSNPHEEDVTGKDSTYYHFEQLRTAMMQDDMLIQYLVDYADESALINRPGYDLRINETGTYQESL